MKKIRIIPKRGLDFDDLVDARLLLHALDDFLDEFTYSNTYIFFIFKIQIHVFFTLDNPDCLKF